MNTPGAMKHVCGNEFHGIELSPEEVRYIHMTRKDKCADRGQKQLKNESNSKATQWNERWYSESFILFDLWWITRRLSEWTAIFNSMKNA